jgi:HlyD family secretion protein
MEPDVGSGNRTDFMNDSSPPPAAQDQDLNAFLGASPAGPARRRVMLIGGAIVALVLILLLSRCFAGGAEEAYATVPVQRGNLTVTVSATGNLAPTNEVEVGSEQSGIVTDVYVDNNDRVTKGQPLARLDTSRLRDAIVQAQAALAAAQAQVAQAQASEAQARANLAREEEVFRISGGKVPSRTELDTARAENKRQIAAVGAARAQVTEARASLASAQTNLSKATIYSPVTGVVLSRQIDPGQTVAASFQAPVLFTIAEDLSRMKLEVKVDEADVGEVAAGQRATFTVDAFPGRQFPATITRVDVGANASNSSSSSSSAASTTGNVVAYTAVLSVANPDLMLRPGMTATADIVTMQKSNALLVPNAALRYSPEREASAAGNQRTGVTGVLLPRPGRRSGGGGQQASIGRGSQQTIYVLGADGKPSAVRIIVGSSNGSETEVLGGDLKPGMKVITGKLSSGSSEGNGRRSGGGSRRAAAAGG